MTKPTRAQPSAVMRFYALLVGNIFEHYDKALYSLLAPYIAHLFFPNVRITTALALCYLPIGMVFRPAGALFFGWMGDRYGGEKVLSLSLLGVALSTMGIGLLPTYASVSVVAPISLSILRGLISFFAAGEQTSAPLILLDGIPKSKRTFWSSLYELTSILGTILATITALLMLIIGDIETTWRIPFIIGSIFCLISRKLRLGLASPPPSTSSEKMTSWIPFFTVIAVTGFSCANYEILSTLLNTLIPYLKLASGPQTLSLYLIFLIFDALLLPFFGKVATRFGKERIINLTLLTMAITVYPVYSLLSTRGIIGLIILRFWLILLGVALAAPYQAWLHETMPKNGRYKTIAIGKALGAGMIGGPAVSYVLYSFGHGNSPMVIPLYLITTSLSALVLLYLASKQLQRKKLFV